MNTPSKYQKAIFNFVDTGKGNALVNAVAGSGKSWTLVEASKHAKGRGIMLAFNKAIADELKPRVPSHFEARTFHSLCYGPVTKAVGVRSVYQNKLGDLIADGFKGDDIKLYAAFARRLVSLAKQSGMGITEPATETDFMSLIEHHDLTLEHENASETRGIQLALQLLEWSNDAKSVDFDDLLYFSVKLNLKLPQYDWVFVDEAQDTNMIQRAILRKILAPKGRLIAVGDPAQAIYGFRGADSNSMDLIAQDFAPVTHLPLSVTYRCPTSVVAKAKEFVKAIEAAPKAKKGEVLSKGAGWKLEELSTTDLIVCRTNRPLITLGYRMLKQNIPVRIMGRDIGAGLKSLAKRCNVGRDNLDSMLEALEKWRIREVEKAKGKESWIENIEDKAGSLRFIAENLPENQRTVTDLLVILDNLFTDDNHRTTLASIHKAKGLEAEKVWWLESSKCPAKWAKQPWQEQQEKNLMYVAITRAKTSLYTIELPSTNPAKVSGHSQPKRSRK